MGHLNVSFQEARSRQVDRFSESARLQQPRKGLAWWLVYLARCPEVRGGKGNSNCGIARFQKQAAPGEES